MKKSLSERILNSIESIGNKLPDPAVLFAILLVSVWIISWLFSGISFDEIDPRTSAQIKINNLLAPKELVKYLTQMVNTFISFPPIGVVLVAMLGLGVAEHSGFINSSIKIILGITPKKLLTPAVIFVAILSHIAVDAGYVLVIPLGGAIFYAAGRHPLAGIAAAFMGVSGGFSATLFVPSSLDPLLAGLTQSAVKLSPLPQAKDMIINPLNNYFFTTASSFLIVLIGWFITDKFIEPRLNKTTKFEEIKDENMNSQTTEVEKKAFYYSILSMIFLIIILIITALVSNSPWKDETGKLTSASSPLMKSIVPLIFIFFLTPGIVYGYISGVFKNHKDVIKAMTKSMNSMSYYIVMAFFCSQFIYAFGQSNIGTLISIKGANFLMKFNLPITITIAGVVLISGIINLFIGSASAKWALIGSVIVPMMMQMGISPDFIQAAYRIGDSSTNIITPLMPYFPLIVVFCQKYVKNAGIGTLISIMLPYSLSLIVLWTLFLNVFYWFGIPLGINASFLIK